MSERNSDRAPAVTSHGAAWPVGPDTPRLAGGEAHVWRADLRAVPENLLGVLADDERERAENIGGERERVLWSSSRAVLRELLGRYLQIASGDVELAIGAHGKPELVTGGDLRTELSFNLSHSHYLALYAFSEDGAVGIDVQAARAQPGVDHIALARRVFGEHEAQRLSLVEPARREREFLRAWSFHEAELKRLGTGIGASADDEAGTDPASAPWVVELNAGSAAAAALALGRRPGELRRWSWA
jgi:4'-phosphopantetheinyl transferase